MKTRFAVLGLWVFFFGFTSLASAVWEDVPLSNPGAETGDMTGWDVDSWNSGFTAENDPSIAYEGDYYFFSEPSRVTSNNVSTSQIVYLSDYTGSILNVEVSTFCKTQSGQRWGYDNETSTSYLYDWKTWLTVNAHSSEGHLFGITFFLTADGEWHETTIPLNLRRDWKEKRDLLDRISIMAKAQYAAVFGGSPPSRDIDSWEAWEGEEPRIVAYDSFNVAVETDAITNSPPVADAGPDQNVVAGESVGLQGSATDPDGDPIDSWSWTIESRPVGSSAAFDDPSSQTTVFTTDLPGEYVFSLVVNDGTSDSAPDTVILTATTFQDAITVYDTMQFGDTTGSTIGVYFGENQSGYYNQPAYGFTPADTVSLDSILIRAGAPYGDVEAVVRIFTDSAGLPGDLLEEWTTTIEQSGFDYRNITVDSVLNPTLQQGTTYWISLSTSGESSNGTWRYADHPAEFQRAYATDGSAQPDWTLISSAVPTGMFKVDGILLPASVEELMEAVENLEAGVVQNRNRSNALTNKIDAVIELILEGLYEEALDKLKHDIIGKTDGCAKNGSPDNNDWITDCQVQADVYSFVLETIELLEILI